MGNYLFFDWQLFCNWCQTFRTAHCQLRTSRIFNKKKQPLGTNNFQRTNQLLYLLVITNALVLKILLIIYSVLIYSILLSFIILLAFIDKIHSHLVIHVRFLERDISSLINLKTLIEITIRLHVDLKTQHHTRILIISATKCYEFI